jgi:hypothetical protein
MCPRQGHNGQVGTYWSELVRFRIYENLITNPVAKITGCCGWGKENRTGASKFKPVKEMGGQMVGQKKGEHMPPYPFTQRLHSMLMLVPYFNINQPMLP